MKETLKNYVCEKCGGELREIGEGRYQCPYCRSEYFKETTLPDELILDLHSANRARSLQRFEDALNEYDRIIASYPDCFDAYWGATLSDYGIQYEKDYDGRMIPTVHRFSETSVLENPYFVNAVKYCKDDTEKQRIRLSAEEIERIRAEIKKTVGIQQPYDIFLCYKETPVGGFGGFTSEFYWASELYIKLRGEGYRVFFAKESLPAARGDYEAHIFPALQSAKLMLILTSGIENLESVWVKNEWSRFIRFSRENPSAGKRFKVIQSGFKPELLPRELRKEQVLNHDSMGWVEQLYAVIKDTFRDKKKEEEERRRREAEEMEARIARSSEERIRELEKRLEEERKSRLEEEQRRQEEEARKRREEEARRNEERIKELERQLAEATKGTSQATSPSTGANTYTSPASSTIASAGNEYDVILSSIGTRKLDVISIIRQILGLGLKDAKDFVESAPITVASQVSKADADDIKSKLSAAGAVVTITNLTDLNTGTGAKTSTGAGTSTFSGLADAKYDVVLTSIGTKKLNVIKALKEALSLGLVDAKNIAEHTPKKLKTGVSFGEAHALKARLDAEGANVTVMPAGLAISEKPASAPTKITSSASGEKEYVTDHKLSDGSFTGYLKNGKPYEGKMTYTSGNVYEGSFENGKRHGSGKMSYTNGDVYTGSWLSDIRSGKGFYTYAGGDTYDGYYQGGKMHGKGTYVWGKGKWAGDRYVGDWVNGVRTGKGKITYANGTTYDGDWIDNKRTGNGVYVHPDGHTYVGQFKDGYMHGKGKYTWGEGKWKGDYYDGEWVNGKRTGYGKYVSSSGSIKEGRFVEGVFQGTTSTAKYVPPAGSVYIEKTFTNGEYKGYAKNGFPHGKGTMRYSNGNVYEGEFFENKINGKGKCTYPNGDVYDGDWVNGNRTGRAKYTYATGNVYEGDFLEGKITGQGKMIFKSGTVYEGGWLNGKMHGRGRHVWGEGNWKGDVYDGDWVNGNRTGYGTYTYASGKVLRGRFENNVFKG